MAWHIPVDLHPSLWEVPKARASAALPLQEKKVNGQSKKTFERAQQRVEVEPLQGWQKERKEDDIWQKERKPDDIWQKERKVDDIRQKERKADDIRRKRDHPWGIPNELWKHVSVLLVSFFFSVVIYKMVLFFFLLHFLFNLFEDLLL